MSSARVVALCALLAGSAFAGSAEESANPIRKVVTLMQDMSKEIEAEGAKEQELYDKFMCFCQGGEAELQKTISDAGATVETLSSQEKEDSAVKSGLEGDLVKHKSDREAATGDLEKATAIRGKEQSEYEEDLADQQSSFDAISGAIPALEQGMGGASLLQSPGVGKRLKHAVEASQVVSSMEKKDVMAFLENKGDYAPQSGQIVGILKNMKDEMEKSIAEIKASEQTASQGFADLKASKEKEIELASEAIESKTKRAGELAVSVVQAQDGAEDAAKEKADAEKFLSTLGEQCKNKEAEHAERSKVRSEEVAAIGEAINIVNDDDALDVFKKAVPSASFSQVAKVGLLQQSTHRASKAKRAQSILAHVATQYKQPTVKLILYTLNSKLKLKHHGKGGFAEVVKMIDDMVVLLGKQQKEDDTSKEFCEAEFDKADDEEKAAKTKLGQLDATLAEETDAITGLAEEISVLKKGIGELDYAVAEATEQRKEEHAEYIETVQLNEAAIGLVGKAKNRLQKFYNPSMASAASSASAAASASFIQEVPSFAQVRVHDESDSLFDVAPPPPPPETFEGGEVKKSGKSAGVMGMMDSIVRDLENDVKDCEYEEKTAQKDYAELMGDSQATRQSDSKAVVDKTAAKAETEGKLMQTKEARAASSEDVKLAAATIADLHSSCDFIMQNYDLRKEARSNEIDSLKNAKAVLSGANFS